MIMKCRTWAEWEKLYDEKGPEHALGMSPGGAAARLGVTRQRVHQLIREDLLDAVRIRDCSLGIRGFVMYVTEASLRRLIESRKKDLTIRKHVA
jgi:hypothetical protein